MKPKKKADKKTKALYVLIHEANIRRIRKMIKHVEFIKDPNPVTYADICPK